MERAARLANEYVIVGKDFNAEVVTEKDAFDDKVFKGPQSLHNAETALKAMDDAGKYKIEQVTGNRRFINSFANY